MNHDDLGYNRIELSLDWILAQGRQPEVEMGSIFPIPALLTSLGPKLI